MRVSFLTREYRGVTSYSGGIGTFYSALGPELARHGHEVHVVTPAGDRREASERDGVVVHALPEALLERDHLGWSAAAARSLREAGSSDVVVAAEWAADGWVYARRKDAGPLVTNLQTSTVQELAISPGIRPWTPYRGRMVSRRVRERFQAQRSDAVLGCCDAILGWAEELWSLDGVPTGVVRNGLDPERVRAVAAAAPDGFPKDGPVIAFSGRVEPRKGPNVLVRAMETVWARHPGARVAFFGADGLYRGGSMTAHLKELAGSRSDRLHFLGNQPPAALFGGLSAADVVTFPSIWEAFSLGALEAMSLGCPLVVSAGSGLEEFVPHERAGLTVPPNDPAALGAALLRLLEDGGLRRRLGTTAAEEVEQYRIDLVAERFVAECERLLAGAGA